MERYYDFRCSSVIFRGRSWKEHAYILSPSGLSPIYESLRNTLYLLCYCGLLEYEMQSKAVIWPHMQGDQPPASLIQAMWCLPRQSLYWDDDWAPGWETWCSEEPFLLRGIMCPKWTQVPFLLFIFNEKVTWVICKFNNNCGLKSCYFTGLIPSILALYQYSRIWGLQQ